LLTILWQTQAAITGQEKPIFRPGYVAIVFGTLVASLIAVGTPWTFPSDDGFFYPQIARNFVMHGRSSFHLIADTNGYHPLWMAVCVLVTYLFSPLHLSADALLGVFFLVQMALLLASLIYLVKLQRLLGYPDPVISLGIVAIIFIGKGTLFLLESHLAFLLLTCATYHYCLLLRASKSDDATLRRFGLIVGLMVLARLDLVFVGALMMAGLMLRIYRRGNFQQTVRPSLALLVPVALPILIYLALNDYFLGSAVPISGIIKSSFPIPHLHFAGQGIYFNAFFSLTVLITLVLLAKRPIHRTDATQERFLLELCLFNLVYLAYLFLFTHTAPWYFLQTILLVALFAEYACGRLLNCRKVPLFVLAALLALANIAMAYGRAYKNLSFEFGLLQQHHRGNDRRETVREVMQALPPEAALLTFDMPGVLAWYSDLRVFPADGLMNDPGYDRALMLQGSQRYLCSHGIGYVFSPIPTAATDYAGYFHMTVTRAGYELTLYGPLAGRSAGSIELPKNSLMVRIPNLLNIYTDYQEFGIWRLPCREF
jgi:hypothetical protein